LIEKNQKIKAAPHPPFGHLLLKEKESGCYLILLKIYIAG